MFPPRACQLVAISLLVAVTSIGAEPSAKNAPLDVTVNVNRRLA
jgi:hypothetical protein